jgi:glycosyltransferase involved in cell wall biosynthesis
MNFVPKVAVVLINRNGYILTEECVRSLVATRYPNLLIVVVDNGSQPGDLEQLVQLSEREKAVLLHPMGYNAGFTKANNAGTELALREHNADYIWILNNDTEVREDAINLSIQAFKEHKLDPRHTIVSSIITYADNGKIWCNGLRDMTLFNFPRAVDKGLPAAQVARPGLVLKYAQYSVGCSMFFARDFVQEHGLMSDEFFIYYDDLDYSLGRNNAHIQQPLVKHKVSSTAGFKGSARFTPFQSFLFAKNGIHYYFRKKKIPVHEKFIYLVFTNWVFVLLYVRDWPTFKAHCSGLWEGLTQPGKPYQPR